MENAPNSAAHFPPPTERIPPPPPPTIAHHPLQPSLAPYNAPLTTRPPHAPLFHYTAPPPPPHNYHSSTLVSRYGHAPPTLAEPLPPPTNLTHLVASPAYHGETNVAQFSAPTPSYCPNTNPTSHFGQGYHPYETDCGPPGSVYCVSRYSYQHMPYQSGGYDPNGYPQVVNGVMHGVSTRYPQYPQAKTFLRSRTLNQHPKEPKHKKPEPVRTDHYCQICNISCSSADHLGIHRKGRKHHRNLEKLQGASTPTVVPQPQKTEDLPKSPSQPVKKKRKKGPMGPASSEDLEVKRKRVYEAGATAEGVRVCDVCNIVVNSQKVLDLHCAGSKHAMMLKKLQESS